MPGARWRLRIETPGGRATLRMSAGVHSGDSMAIYPGLTLSEDEVLVDVEERPGFAVAIDSAGLAPKAIAFNASCAVTLTIFGPPGIPNANAGRSPRSGRGLHIPRPTVPSWLASRHRRW